MGNDFPLVGLAVFILSIASSGALCGIMLTENFKKLPYDKIQHAQEVCSSNEGIKHLTHGKVVCNNSASFGYK